MAKCKYDWPDAGQRHLIGQRIKRIDGPAKASGKAKYTFDINRPGLLYGKIYRSPYAHAKIKSLDVSEVKSSPGVKAVKVIQDAGTEIQWAGDEIVAVAAVSEQAAEDALRKIKIEFEELPFLVLDDDLSLAGDRAKPAGEQKSGDPEKAFSEPDLVISEGFYGTPVITHCCLESHGTVSEWSSDGRHLTAWVSTQNVSGIPAELGEAIKTPATDIEVICDYIGGGFGSKFAIDRWGVVNAQLAKETGKPVKLLLDRNMELEVAGARPSAYAKVKVAAKKDGTIVAWESDSWANGGLSGGNMPPIPYVFNIPNKITRHKALVTNIGGARAWRAPGHPQAAVLTICALDDLAAKLNMDPIEFFSKNAGLTGERAEIYKQELQKAAELAEWSKLWHPRGDKRPGHIKRGLGVSLHTWGGRGHNSNCNVTVNPDGSVEVALGSQDLGTGTRTVIAITAAETFGLRVEDIKVNIGSSKYPASGASGGSTTVGGVSASTRRGCVDALDQLLATVAPSLGAKPEDLEAVGGRIQVKGDSSKSLTWKQACQKLGVRSIQTTGKNPGQCSLGSSGVGGVEIADVSVDTETGIVKMNRMVCAQDCGLIIDLKTAESQCLGAMIMGITYSLFEEKIMDQQTGRMLNPNMEFYKLAGIGDIGELVVHMMTGPGYDERGVIGLGEPPVISPGAAISNAVANAIGVRVPTLPITPEKVLAALEKGGMA
ncbi:MAG TPA: xanthine dehydrogenase family protein molybdopterin-binding subunit [Terriglobia bacterium]|jgi:xanthine dehydrogenase YagR molybdenum-binding subunit|nr:xanthine dehydrogenase family protein molybdopterin-binding subunit [Terriglobia bacterium]